MAEYEEGLKKCTRENDTLRRENLQMKQHLANMEVSFSDVHTKYERSKIIIEGYKKNEEAMKISFASAESVIKSTMEKYNALKAHAQAQIDK